MKVSSTSKRLAEYMALYQKRQIDILEDVRPYAEEFGTKINKSEISQYLSGKFEPGSEKIYVLSVALGVNPLWLMGYDEPMYKIDEQEKFKSNTFNKEQPAENYDELYQKAAELLLQLKPRNLEIFKRLTPQNLDRLFGYAERLLEEQSDAEPDPG